LYTDDTDDTEKPLKIRSFSVFSVKSVYQKGLITAIPNEPLNVGLLICGLTWPLANVVQVAMIVDSAPVETLMGTYTGLRQIAVTLGFIIGPILGGSLVEAMGNNYRWVWLIMFVFLVLATVAILPVTKGEAKKELSS
jgi:MFS family permease